MQQDEDLELARTDAKESCLEQFKFKEQRLDKETEKRRKEF